MGMRAKLRHVSPAELKAAKKEPAKFYRDLYGLEGQRADRGALLQSLGLQLGAAIQASPLKKEFADMPEARRVAAAIAGRSAVDPGDQEILAKRMLELLPRIGFRPRFSEFLPKATRIPKGLELEKSWHCLHFLFSGKVWEMGKPPIEKAILGGMDIPDTERVMGYGPIRYLEHEKVKRISVALASYPIKRKASSFDPRSAEAAKIYSPNHSLEELVYYFNLLRNYYREAASKQHAMLLWIE